MNVFDTLKPLVTAAERAGRWKYLALAALLSPLLLFFAPASPSATDTWVAVRSQKLEQEIGLVGKVEPVETTIIHAPFDGYTLSNEVSAGMQIEQGQALLTLDTALLEIQIREALAGKLRMQQAAEVYRAWATSPEVMQARQALRVAQLSMRTLELELSQVQGLYQKGIVARNELDALKQQRDMQTLDLKAARAQLKTVQAAGMGKTRDIAEMEYRNASVGYEHINALLELNTLRAPFSGVVLSLGGPQLSGAEVVALHKGALVTKGQQLMKLANMDGLKVIAQVSESDVNKFSLNQKVALTGGGFLGQQLDGYVSAISQMAVEDEGAGNGAKFPLTITVTAPESGDFKNVRLGMSVHMKIVTYRNDNSFIIPHGAVEQADGGTFVEHREGLDAPPVRRAVTIGQSTAEGVEVFGVESGFVRVK